MPSYIKSAALLAAALPFAVAQTYTSCNPLKQSKSVDGLPGAI